MIHWQPGVTLDEVERQVIMAALRFYYNNKSQAAASLGISVRTIQNKLQQYEQQRLAAIQGSTEVPPGH